MNTTNHPDYPVRPGDPAMDRCVCDGPRHWHAVPPYGCDDCACEEFKLADVQPTLPTRKPWPRTTASGASIFKVFDADGRNMNQWLVSSKSIPGAFRLVTFHMDRTVGAWWECGCPRGANIAAAGGKMGAGRPDRPCRHVLAVVDAEHDDGVPPRPSAPAAVSQLCD